MSPHLANAVQDFVVQKDEIYPTHSIIKCRIVLKNVLKETKHFRQHTPLLDLATKDFILGESHGPDEEYPTAHEFDGNYIRKGWHWKTYWETLQSNVDNCYKEIKPWFDKALDEGNLDHAYNLWVRCLNMAVSEHTGSEPGDFWKSPVRGIVSYVKRKTRGFAKFVNGELVADDINPLIANLSSQGHKLHILARLVRNSCKRQDKGIGNTVCELEAIHQLTKSILASCRIACEHEDDLSKLLEEKDFTANHSWLVDILLKHAERYEYRLQRIRMSKQRDKTQRAYAQAAGDVPL